MRCIARLVVIDYSLLLGLHCGIHRVDNIANTDVSSESCHSITNPCSEWGAISATVSNKPSFPTHFLSKCVFYLCKNLTWPNVLHLRLIVFFSHPEFSWFLPGIRPQFSQVLSWPMFCSWYFNCASGSILMLPHQRGTEPWKTARQYGSCGLGPSQPIIVCRIPTF